MTVDALVREARKRLAEAPFEVPGREALLLLGRVLGWSEAQVLARGDREVDEETEARFRQLLDRRLTGEPVAYLLGEREFYGRVFHVDRRVLVPRPETEHLVETALGLDLPERARVLDVGTGSGCIAVTLALERPPWRVSATDLSVGALTVARANARRLGARVAFAGADLAAGIDLSSVSLVVSNPPYLGRAEAERISPEVRDFEPHVALFSPGRSDAVLNRLLDLERHLLPSCWLVLEIGHEQVDALRTRASERSWSVERVVDDLAGIARVVALRHHG